MTASLIVIQKIPDTFAQEVFHGQTVWKGEVDVLIFLIHRKRIASNAASQFYTFPCYITYIGNQSRNHKGIS